MPYTGPDGSFYNLVSLSLTPPTDTRYGGCKVIIKYTSGPRLGKFEEIADIPSPRTSADVLWKPPAGSQTSDWYFVSYNKLGQLNTIQAGTPKVSNTVGATSQFDFTQVKLSTISDQFRIDPLTGVPTMFQFSALLLTDQLQVGGGTLNGVCSTVNSGADTAVTKSSGDSFTSAMVGTYIYIHGSTVKVKTYSGPTSIVVATNLGTHSGYNWSYGRPPQFKIFDRSNTEMGFWGDDSYNTGFVGLWAGRDVRLGGTIGNPIIEVDPGGAVTIDGASFIISETTSGTTSTLTIDDSVPVFLFNINDTDHYRLGLAASQLLLELTTGTNVFSSVTPTDVSVRSGNKLGGINSGEVFSGDLSLANSYDFRLLSGKFTVYDNKNTAGLGVPPIYASVSLTGQTGSIGATNLQVGGSVAPAGLYRVSWYGRCTTASGSDTLTVTISYNDGTGARSQAFAFLLSSTAANGTQTISIVIKADGFNNVQYSTTRSGATGSPQYALDISMERLS